MSSVPNTVWWTPEEMAAQLRVTTAQLQYLRKMKKGPPYTKVGRRVRYPVPLVQQWLKQGGDTHAAR